MNKPPDINGLVATVAAVSSATTVAVDKLVTALLKWLVIKRKSDQQKQEHQHEMTVRLKISEEYERLIESMDRRLQSMAQEIGALSKKLADAEARSAKAEAENVQLRARVQQLEDRLPASDGRE